MAWDINETLPGTSLMLNHDDYDDGMHLQSSTTFRGHPPDSNAKHQLLCGYSFGKRPNDLTSRPYFQSWHGGWKLVIRMVCVGVWVEIADLTRTFSFWKTCPSNDPNPAPLIVKRNPVQNPLCLAVLRLSSWPPRKTSEAGWPLSPCWSWVFFLFRIWRSAKELAHHIPNMKKGSNSSWPNKKEAALKWFVSVDFARCTPSPLLHGTPMLRWTYCNFFLFLYRISVKGRASKLRS